MSDGTNNGWIKERFLLDGVVTADKLGALAVSSAKLAAGAVTEAKLAADALALIKARPAHQVQAAITANGTEEISWWPAEDITISAIEVIFKTAPASAGGTYTLAIEGAGNNLLAAATFDLETLVSDTLTALTLTATTADLSLSADDEVKFTLVSDNADLTGAGGYIRVSYSAQ